MIFPVTPGDWIALAGLAVTFGALTTGVVYRLGRLDERLREVVRRLERVEGKLDRSGRKNNSGYTP